MATKRRRFPAAEKVGILRRHLLEKTPVSDLCDEFAIRPTVFYRWQKQLFESGAAAFDQDNDAEKRQLENKVSGLETRLAHKDEVIAEIMESHVQLKKKLGQG